MMGITLLCLVQWARSNFSLATLGVRAVFASTMICIFLAGCGRSANTPGSVSLPIAAKPNVIITFDGKRHACVVALYTEEQGNAISCKDVVPFVRDELRVPSGSIYDFRAIPDADEAEVAGVAASLNGAGYRFIGGPNAKLTGAPR
jgi:hypothetical protein